MKVLYLWIFLTWLLPFVVAIIPPLAGFGMLGYNEKYSSCSAVSTAPHSNEYDILSTVILFPVALLIMIVAYIMIFVHVRKHSQKFVRHRRTINDGKVTLPVDALPSGTEEPNGMSTTSSGLSVIVQDGESNAVCNSDHELAHLNNAENKTVNLEETELGTDTADIDVVINSNKLRQNVSLNDTKNYSPSNSADFQTENSLANKTETHESDESVTKCTNHAFAKDDAPDEEAHTQETYLNNQSIVTSSSSCNSNDAPKNEHDIALSDSTKRILQEIDNDDRPGSMENSSATDTEPNKPKRNVKASKRYKTVEALKNISFPRPKLSEREVDITKNMFYVVVAFFICFTPFTLCMIIDTSDPFLPYATAIVFINSCINPIIYAIKHPNFKTTFGLIIRCRWREIRPPSKLLRSLLDKEICCCKRKDEFSA